MSEPTPNRRNFIVTPEGDLINLDFVSKIKLGTTYVPPIVNCVFICHGIGQGAGAQIKYVYVDQPTADAAFAKLVDTVDSLGIVTRIV